MVSSKAGAMVVGRAGPAIQAALSHCAFSDSAAPVDPMRPTRSGFPLPAPAAVPGDPDDRVRSGDVRRGGGGTAQSDPGVSSAGGHAPEGRESRADEFRRLRAIVEQSPAVIIVTNRRCEITWVNRAFTEVTGWTFDEVRGCSPRSFLHGPRTDQAEAARLAGLTGAGQPVTAFELVNYKKSGEPYWVSLNVRPVTDRNGQVVEFIAIQTDITERKRREADLQRVQHRLAQAHRLARLGWLEHELASGRVVFSPEVARFLGIDPAPNQEAPIAELARFVHPADAERAKSVYEQAINSGCDFVSEHRVLNPAGEVRWIRMRGAIEGWEDGNPAVFRLVAQDVTERLEADRVARQREALERAARSQTEALARLTDWLRAPLRVVLGLAEILERSAAGMSARDLALVRQVQAAGGELRHIVDGVAELVSLRSGATFDAVPIDLYALGCEAATVHEASAVLHRIAIRVAPAASRRAIVVGDARRLRQLLALLIGEAIDHSRPGGQILVTIEAGDEGTIRLDVYDPDRAVDAADLEGLFEPLCRSPAAGRAAGDACVRLAVCLALVEGMGGAIRAESDSAGGLRLVALLPAAGETVVPIGRSAAGGRSDAAVRAHPLRLLCIDEDVVSNVLVEGLLERRKDLSLRFERTAGAGLVAAREMKPDLILVALQLPDMSGYECLQRLHADGKQRRAPCVAMSADAGDDAVVAAIRAGFRDFLSKPARRGDLLGLLDRVAGE